MLANRTFLADKFNIEALLCFSCGCFLCRYLQLKPNLNWTLKRGGDYLKDFTVFANLYLSQSDKAQFIQFCFH